MVEEKILIELKTLRYLYNNLTLSFFEVNRKLDLLLKQEGKEVKIPLPQPVYKTDRTAVKFELFTLTEIQYNRLVKEFGNDIVIRSCVMLDDFIKDKGYIPHRTPFQALKKVIIIQALKERVEDTKVEIVDSLSIDYTQIETVKDAYTYIRNVPSYMRNVEEGCRYLVDKFKIDVEYKD